MAGCPAVILVLLTGPGITQKSVGHPDPRLQHLSYGTRNGWPVSTDSAFAASAIVSSLFTPNLRNSPVVVVLLLLLELGICIVSILTKIFRGKFHTRNTLNFLPNSSSSDHVKGDRLDAFAGPQGHHPPAVSEAIHLHCLFGASKGHYENVILLYIMANKP